MSLPVESGLDQSGKRRWPYRQRAVRATCLNRAALSSPKQKPEVPRNLEVMHDILQSCEPKQAPEYVPFFQAVVTCICTPVPEHRTQASRFAVFFYLSLQNWSFFNGGERQHEVRKTTSIRVAMPPLCQPSACMSSFRDQSDRRCWPPGWKVGVE